MGGIRHHTLCNRMLGYRGQQVFAYIRQEVEINGIAPSYGMIRDALGFGDKAEVCRVVQKLERRGLLNRAGEGRVRRIRLAL